MSGATSIQWTDATWNPIRGCSMAKGSELGGCLNCYAARQASRFTGEGSPFSGFARVTENGPRWTGKVELVEKHLLDPLKWKTPRRVFVNSMSDLFHEALPDEAIDRVFAVMALCPQHTFQVLTKRPSRMLRWSVKSTPDRIDAVIAEMGILTREEFEWPLPNVWLGVSVEDFGTWDDRVRLLRETPAAVRFVSYEPALAELGSVDMDGLDWLIIGGESGPGARPFDIGWARDTVAQCRDAGVACFVKQLGARPHGPEQSVPDWVTRLDRKGGNWEVWPEDLRVREFPTWRRRGTSQWAQSPPGEDFRDRQLRAALDGEPLGVISGRVPNSAHVRIDELERSVDLLSRRLLKLEESR